MQTNNDELKKVLATIAKLNQDHMIVRERYKALDANYKELLNLFMVLLHDAPNKEFEIHTSQFLKIMEPYEVQRTYDAESQTIKFKLITKGG